MSKNIYNIKHKKVERRGLRGADAQPRPKQIMKKHENKQTLISLSLAGAIGYYLYNKLIKAGMAGATIDHSDADAKTRDELSWRPEPEVIPEPEVVEETVFDESMFLTPVAEEVTDEAEEIVEEVEEAVEEIEEVIEEPEIELPIAVEEVTEEVAEETAEEVAEESAVEDGEESVICAACGASNAVGVENCEYCGSQIALGAEEKAIEDAIEEPEAVEPELNIGELSISLDEEIVSPDIELETEIIPEEIEEVSEVVENPVEIIEEVAEEVGESEADIDDGEDELSVDEMFDAVDESENVAEEPERVIMDNVEPLHKIDHNDKSEKKQYKSILDFVNTL